jgi:hypothetical protein
MSISGISFWQADRNWFIQQRVLTLSTQASAPVVPAADQSSHAAREADRAAAFNGGTELKSAAISGLELNSSTGYTAGLTAGGATGGIATNDIATNDVNANGPAKSRHLLDRIVG